MLNFGIFFVLVLFSVLSTAQGIFILEEQKYRNLAKGLGILFGFLSFCWCMLFFGDLMSVSLGLNFLNLLGICAVVIISAVATTVLFIVEAFLLLLVTCIIPEINRDIKSGSFDSWNGDDRIYGTSMSQMAEESQK